MIKPMNHGRLRPLIGVSACLKENGRGWVHSVGDKYVQAAIRAVGGLPVIIPAFGREFDADEGMTEALDRLLDHMDGVLLTGSPSNVEPHHYEGTPSRAGTAHDAARDATTLPLIRHAIDDGVPLFAICRGAQEVNVALGGTLHQLVHEVPGRRDHRSPRTQDTDVNYALAHDIEIVEGGLLHRLVGARTARVNSLHGQGVARLGETLVGEAIAPDGAIEAFRRDGGGFLLGVQWHPEWQVTGNPFYLGIFRAFGDAAIHSRSWLRARWRASSSRLSCARRFAFFSR